MRGRIKSVFKYTGLVVIWILVLAVALFPAKYINNAYGYLAFLFLFLLLMLSLIILFVLKRTLTIDTSFKNDIQCIRGESVDLSLTIKNESIFFCSHAKAHLYISDLFENVDTTMQTDFTIAAKSESKFEFNMDMNHIGVYQVGLKDMKIYDMFGIFWTHVPIQNHIEVYVKPRIYAMNDLTVEEEVLIDSSRDSRNTLPNGLDYIGVREYTPGDSMKQIHWKLSAHSLNYMTKISENSRQSDFAVILDFSAYKAEKEELMDLYDTLIETAFSVIEELSHREVTYSLIYCDKQREIRRSIPQGRDNDMEYIRRFDIITPEPDQDYPDGSKILNQEALMPNRSTNLIICTSRITTEFIQEMISIKRQRRSPELYFIIPDRLTERERENLMAPLRDLDDFHIAWHCVSTLRNRQMNHMNREEKG